MKIRSLVFAAAVALGPVALTVPQAVAQPMWDVVHVNLPYTVTLGKQTIPPGDYTIQQLHSDDSTVLLFYSDHNKHLKFQTSAMTIKALGNTDNTPDATTLSLHQVGDQYYFDKIFIQGKDYGYEFPLPASVRAREKELASVSVPAQSTTTTTAADTTNATTVNTSDEITTAPPVVDTTPATQPATPPDVAMTTPVAPPAEPQVTTDTTSQTTATTTSASTEDSANREKRPASDNTPAMPSTSAGWLMMLVSGGTLSGAGMLLRRKR